MIFGVHHLVWYLSQFMVLHPGDLINTGTPAGVALGTTGEPYLRAGDVVELWISGLGTARQQFEAAPMTAATVGEFAGLVGLVTGGGAGIGAAITAELRSQGATVAVLDVQVPPMATMSHVTSPIGRRSPQRFGRCSPGTGAWTSWSTTPVSLRSARSRRTTTPNGTACWTSTWSAWLGPRLPRCRRFGARRPQPS